ncbi:glycosyltransferase family 9 protein [Providencia rettgeri]|nr:glycosyltransferase family 9 protein [Providencia rettgeri]
MSLYSSIKKANRYRNIKTKKIKNKLKLFFIYHLYRKRNPQLEDYYNVCFFLHSQAIGDSIITSGLIKKIRQKGKKVFIVAPEKVRFLFSGIIEVDGFYAFNKHKITSLVKELKKLHIDLVIDTFDYDPSVMQRLQTLFLLKPQKSLCFDHPKNTIFDINLVSDDNAHLSNRMMQVLDLLDVNFDLYQYSLSFDSIEFESVHKYAKKIKEKNKLIIFNPFASQKSRSLSVEQVYVLLEYLNSLENCKTIIFNLGCNISTSLFENVELNPFKSAGESFALASNADIIITVDTAIVHLASAFNIKQYCIYNNRLNNWKQNNNIMFGPNSKNAVQLTTTEYLNTEVGDDMSKFDMSLLIDKLNDDLKGS